VTLVGWKGVPAPRAPSPWTQRSPTAREAILEPPAIRQEEQEAKRQEEQEAKRQEEQEAKRNLTGGDFLRLGESLMRL